jgi:hypothetical protein
MLARFDRINKAPFFTSARNSSYFIWKTLVTIYQGDLTQTGLAPKAKASVISCHLGLHVEVKKKISGAPCAWQVAIQSW